MGTMLVGYSADNYPIESDGTNCYIDYTVDGSGGFVQTQCPGSTISNPNPYSLPSQTPAISINQGGVSVLSTGLDKVMASILSGLALMTGAPYVPTTTQPVKQNYTQYPGTGYPTNYNPATGQYLAASNVNTGASIQTWLQQNMVVVALGIGAFMLFKSGRK
jgi:hypothetical protein